MNKKNIFLISAIVLFFTISFCLALLETNFTSPTEIDGSLIERTNILMNISIQGENLKNLSLQFNNSYYNLYDESLVLMMNFDNVSSLGENDTNVVDVSQSGNNGTVSGAIWNSSGKYGGAYQFDDNSINLGTLNPLPNGIGTISVWAKVNNMDQTKSNYLVTKGNDAIEGSWGVEIGTQTDCNRVCFLYNFIWPNGQWVCTPCESISEGWHHIVAVAKNDSTQQVYIDGIIKSSGTFSVFTPESFMDSILEKQQEMHPIPIILMVQ